MFTPRNRHRIILLFSKLGSAGPSWYRNKPHFRCQHQNIFSPSPQAADMVDKVEHDMATGQMARDAACINSRESSGWSHGRSRMGPELAHEPQQEPSEPRRS